MSVTYTIRFLGDPVGYTVETDLPLNGPIPDEWIEARRGVTDELVYIDAAKAYLVEVSRARATPSPEVAA